MRELNTPLRRLNANIPADLYRRLAEASRRQDRTMSAVLVRALASYLGLSESNNRATERDPDSAEEALRHDEDAKT